MRETFVSDTDISCNFGHEVKFQSGGINKFYLELILFTESVCLLCGIPIGYSTPLTMIDTSSKIKKGTKGDASMLRPTCLSGVPVSSAFFFFHTLQFSIEIFYKNIDSLQLILDRISKGIGDKVSKGSPLQQAIFKFAYNYRRSWMSRGFDTPLLNK